VDNVEHALVGVRQLRGRVSISSRRRACPRDGRDGCAEFAAGPGL